MSKLHTNREYENELSDLRARLVMMAGRIDEMLANAMRALIQGDSQLALSTIESDHRVNRDEVEMDELCLVILAKRQPLGADLRFITIALKMVTDLERIGDLAVNICERVLKLEKNRDLKLDPRLSEMSNRVQSMIKEAIDAFIHSDPDKAESVIQKDDQVDELYHAMFRDLLQEMKTQNSPLEALIHIQSVAKWLERAGDHCTNLAELVVFMVRGTDIRHLGKLDQSA